MKILFFLITLCAIGKEISLQEVLKFTIEHYPEIQIQTLKKSISDAKITESRGAFDLNLKSEGKGYLDGFYDSEFGKIFLDKPIQSFNSKAKLGFRKSNGNLPVYYEEYETDNDGEFFAKFDFSLLRFRQIDQKRFKIIESQNKAKIQQLKLKLKIIDSKNKANKSFLKWAFYKRKEQIYLDLIDINKKRLKAIEIRVKRNDLAQIYLAESTQYLLNFQNQLIETQIELKKAYNQLKVFYPLLSYNDSPNFSLSYSSKFNPQNYVLEKAYMNRPEIQMIKFMKNTAQNSLQLSEQYLAPKLDFSTSYYKTNNDTKKFQDETLVGITLSIPIERKLGKGKIEQSKSTLKLIDATLTDLKLKVALEIENLKAEIKGDIQALKNIDQEVKIAKRLQNAEWIKFKNGASDFFLTNTRDVNYIKASLNYMQKIVELKIARFNLNLWFEKL